jgi:exopolysaccharide biosynthesis polyprenyl glycosylphosphotransferase
MSATGTPVPVTAELVPRIPDVGLLPWPCEDTAELAHCYRPRDAVVRRGLAAADTAALMVAVLAVLAPATRDWTLALWALALVPGWVALLRAYGLYDGDIKRFSRGMLQDLPGALHAVLVCSLLTWAALGWSSAGPVSSDVIIVFSLVLGAGLIALRAAARRAMHRMLGPERALIIGDSASIPLLGRKLAAHQEYGVVLVGVVSGTEPVVAGGPPRLGDPADLDLAAVATAHRLDRVILAGSRAIPGALADLVRTSHRLGLKVDYLPHPMEVLGTGVEVDDIEGVTVFGLYPPVLCRSSRALKRAMDIVGAAVLLLLTAPLLLLIAIAVRLDSPGPALFRHERIGRGGRRFSIAKFRTMVVGAEAMAEELLAQSRDPDWLLLDDDPRVTRIGGWLRRSSFDELPQLWSVLRGDMSLVGPRPLVPSEDRRITGWGRRRLDLTPGLTGLWQVLGRTSIPFEEMVKLDYTYVTTWSVWGDLQLLLRTLPVLVTRRGAN